jgi:hypothetical protein
MCVFSLSRKINYGTEVLPWTGRRLQTSVKRFLPVAIFSTEGRFIYLPQEGGAEEEEEEATRS